MLPSPPPGPDIHQAAVPVRAVRILIVDDIPCVRRAIRSLLEEDPGVRVVGEAGDGSEALKRTMDLSPDVVLMDINMPIMDGLFATRLIHGLPNPPRVLVMTESDDELYTRRAFEAGAGGFLHKKNLTERLIATVRSVA
jgi:DNA-binding NarL/FixJ family response regulator